ncbi:hypothetical protein SAMN04515671_1437 [Nakamurella panacisegetis]|uniref:Uncharacterized protein n=1 Tax=Nakamurella panacisegetis TaxID=1090615 RepID=A0A1H0KVA7_9ACTN|nr:hypothetical protein [Nakamurella panacisegetis]SDO59726.1 hypothetical protein SAMN04515671_1437 [Nakamurella panacisegetis]
MIHIEHVTSEVSAKGEENWFPGWRAERYLAMIESHRRPEDSDLPIPVWLDDEPPSRSWPNVAQRFFLGSVEVQTSTGSIVGGPQDWPRLGFAFNLLRAARESMDGLSKLWDFDSDRHFTFERASSEILIRATWSPLVRVATSEFRAEVRRFFDDSVHWLQAQYPECAEEETFRAALATAHEGDYVALVAAEE